MSNLLQQNYQNMTIAFDMMKNLHEIFGHQNRQAFIKEIMNIHMKSGTSVKDHILNRINHFHVTEILRANIDSRTQIDMVLKALFEMFS